MARLSRLALSLRTRIAVTFLVLLTAVLGAQMAAVWIEHAADVKRSVTGQVDNNWKLLTLAATAVARDDGFHDTITEGDPDTLVSALRNEGERIGATLVVLTQLDGTVTAAYGTAAPAGSRFPLHADGGTSSSRGKPADGTTAESGTSTQPAAQVHFMVDHGSLYQVVAVPVNMPAQVAWLAMGFELDPGVAAALAANGALGESVFELSGQGWRKASARSAVAGLIRHTGVAPSTFSDPGAPFKGLKTALIVIAALSLAGFAIAAFWIARNITRPLHDLTRSVDQMRSGDYGVTLSVKRRDEIGLLAEGLQLMQTAIMTRDRSIRRLAYEDTLTGLMNRHSFNSRLAAALDAAGDSPIAVAVMNLNRFSRINEHLGYAVGDAVLTGVATRLAAIAGADAAVARLAADQFGAFTRLADSKGAHAWGATLLAAVADSALVERQPIDVSATIGLALSNAAGPEAADELLIRADLALEQARRKKQPLAVYDATLDQSGPDQLSLLGELRRAVEQDEFVLYFQPKIELSTGRVAGAEVLIRWQHPARGLLSPAAFIPFAEQTGFIRQITRWMLDRAIAQAVAWHRAGQPLPLAVNISAEDIADVHLDARVARMLTRHECPPSILTLEVTESGFIDDPASAMRMLEALATLGVNISIDDFGTGYSSLSQLARMPATELKIDRSFVLGLESDPAYAAIVRSAIDMGHSLGVKVVAEGIENEESGRRLTSLGCDIAQGYFYARPMTQDALMRWLEGRARVPIIVVPIDFDVGRFADTMTLASQ
jgi:diguanylate cyclase (GGDEF)-like protein